MSDTSEESQDTPAVRLGRQLRRVRLAAGYATHLALARRIGFGEDVVQKAETGKRVPSREVFPAILDACTTTLDGTHQVITDGERETLTELWEIARKGSGPIPEFIETYLRQEDLAEFLRLWSIILIPGLLQIRDYALAMYDLPGIDQDEAAATVDFYMNRQSIIQGPSAPQVLVVLDESVLYRLIGTPEILVRQLDHLMEMMEWPNVTIQVARGTGAYWGLVGSFDIASRDGAPDTLKMLTVEDQIHEDRNLTRKSLIIFEKLRGYALNIGDSRAALMEAREHWNSQQQA
ncbi:MAG TPA: helix-turn-helix transcriptional regulator [Trebonia sp.]|nr:helix-turn-helix transcriptional regulator [Trebonia sp.]